MKTLIAEDDFTSRLLLQEILSSYGPTHVAVNNQKTVDAIKTAIKASKPYELICLDIMMPEMDGHEVLKQIRAFERAGGTPAGKGVKVIMTTALRDKTNVLAAIGEGCDAYLVKPFDKAKLQSHLRSFGLIE